MTYNGTDGGAITFIVPYNAPSTLYYNCQFHAMMAGTINVTCQRPSGLTNFGFNDTRNDTSLNFTGSLVDACAAKNAGTGLSGRLHQAESLVVGKTVYYGINYTNCTLVPTGYYLAGAFPPYQVVYIVDGVIDSLPSCE